MLLRFMSCTDFSSLLSRPSLHYIPPHCRPQFFHLGGLGRHSILNDHPQQSDVRDGRRRAGTQQGEDFVGGGNSNNFIWYPGSSHFTYIHGQIFYLKSGCLVLTGVEVMFNRYEEFGTGNSTNNTFIYLCTMYEHSAIELFAGMGGLAVGAGGQERGREGGGEGGITLLHLRRSYTHYFHFALRILLGGLIMTAMAVQDVYAILAAFGIGLDFALGAGVMTCTHVAANQARREEGREGGEGGLEGGREGRVWGLLCCKSTPAYNQAGSSGD